MWNDETSEAAAHGTNGGAMTKPILRLRKRRRSRGVTAQNEKYGKAYDPSGVRLLLSHIPGCRPLSRAYPGLTNFNPRGIPDDFGLSGAELTGRKNE
jgi:hypothetical protein